MTSESLTKEDLQDLIEGSTELSDLVVACETIASASSQDLSVFLGDLQHILAHTTPDGSVQSRRFHQLLRAVEGVVKTWRIKV